MVGVSTLADQDPVGSLMLNGVRISLDMLSAIFSAIPIPGLNAGILAACEVIKLADAVQTNKEEREELMAQVYSVMFVVANSLKGKTEADVSKDLNRRLQRLSAGLLRLANQLEDLNKKPGQKKFKSILQVINHVDVAKKIKKLTNELAWAVREFQVESQISAAIKLDGVSIGVNQILSKLEDMELNNSSSKQPETSVFTSSLIAPKPSNFIGRDDEVSKIVRLMASPAHPRIAILGPGGIGKSSVAQAVNEDLSIQRRFGERRTWVRCEAASTPELLVELLARSVNASKKTTQRLEDVMAVLRAENAERLLIVDNFETPWDISGKRSDVLDIMTTLGTNPKLTILYTMRGTPALYHDIPLTAPAILLPTLSRENARDLYLKICPDDDEDPKLDTLLRELSYMPLAVTLMAKVGLDGETPSELLERWKKDGSEVISEPDGDRRLSVNRSIQVSLESNLMKANPDAKRLLSVMAYFPGGVQKRHLSQLVPSIKKVERLRSVLLHSSLVYMSADQSSYFVLSPIRTYISQYYSVFDDKELWHGITDFYDSLLQKNHTFRRKPEMMREISLELTNLDVVLDHYLTNCRDSKKAIATAHEYLWYFYWTVPREDLLKSTVEKAKKVGDSALIASSHYILGDWDIRLGKLPEARVAYQVAIEMYELIEDDHGYANCLRGLGDVDQQLGNYDEAKVWFEKGREAYIKVEDYVGLSYCILGLGQIDRQRGLYNKAAILFEESRDVGESVSNDFVISESIIRLGDTDMQLGLYDRARERYEEASDMFKKAQNALSMACGVYCMGCLNLKLGDYDEAQTLVEEALEEFIKLDSISNIGKCYQALGEIQLKMGNFAKARIQFKEGQKKNDSMKRAHQAARCAQGLGEVDLKEGKFLMARITLGSTRSRFQGFGDRKGVAQCTRSLAEVEIGSGNVEKAIPMLEEAIAEFQELELRIEAEGCRVILDRIDTRKS